MIGREAHHCDALLAIMLSDRSSARFSRDRGMRRTVDQAPPKSLFSQRPQASATVRRPVS